MNNVLTLPNGRASEELLGEVGDGQGEESANHPGNLVKLRVDEGHARIEVLARHQIRLRICERSHHGLRLLLVEASVTKPAGDFQGVKGHGAHGCHPTLLDSRQATVEDSCKECDDSESSGIRTRQSCGFFVLGHRVMAGRATDTTPRKGEEVHRLLSVINLPATSRVRVMTAPRGFSELKQESHMTTTDLVPVFTGTLAGQPTPICNARDLHAALGVGRDFTTWIKERIAEYAFAEGEDFSVVAAPPIRGAGNRGKRTDYHLSLDMAKELSMVENNDLGRRIRRYLIALEKKQGTALSLPAPQPPAPTLAGRRWLIVVAQDGSETAHAIDPEHFFTKINEFPETIRDVGFLATGDELAEIIRSCVDRLAGKLAGRARRAA